MTADCSSQRAMHGRGAADNPANRFDRLVYEPNVESLQEESSLPDTQVLRDVSRSLIPTTTVLMSDLTRASILIGAASMGVSIATHGRIMSIWVFPQGWILRHESSPRWKLRAYCVRNWHPRAGKPDRWQSAALPILTSRWSVGYN